MSAKATSFDLNSVIGFKYKDEDVIWNQRDAILYALSIGAHLNNRNMIYEGVENPKLGPAPPEDKFQVFPTFATTLSFKGTETDVFSFAAKFGGEDKPAGLPPLDPNTLVQASQYFEILTPLPPVSGPGWKVQKTIVGAHEAADGVTFDNQLTLVDGSGKVHARMIAQAKYLGGKINGVPFDAVDYKTFHKMPPIATLGRPTWTMKGSTWETQTALFRLNGDYNPLHIEPRIGAQTIYKGVILHGLGMWGITARALVEKLSGNDPSKLHALTALFIGPIIPGDTLHITIWDMGPAPDGSASSIAFEARSSSGSLCLGEGRAYITIDKSAILPELDPIATAFTGVPHPNPNADVVRPANGPKQPKEMWIGPTFKGVPVLQVLPVLFWAPMIVANLLYVWLSYLFTWWFQW